MGHRAVIKSGRRFIDSGRRRMGLIGSYGKLSHNEDKLAVCVHPIMPGSSPDDRTCAGTKGEYVEHRWDCSLENTRRYLNV